MFVHALKNQFVRDLKASWQKTAILGALLLVGLTLWIPPLVRAMMGSTLFQASETSPRGSQATSTVETETDFRVPTVEFQTEPTGYRWQGADEFLQSDPLVRSVEVAAIQSDPFRIDHDQFSPPILFADEPAGPQDSLGQTNRQTGRENRNLKPDGLVLKSTIVGVQRRAAFINNKLYFEGHEIQVDGETYELTAVETRKVVIRRGNTTFELKLPARTGSGTIEVQAELSSDD